jgi:hypothetical protein
LKNRNYNLNLFSTLHVCISTCRHMFNFFFKNKIKFISQKFHCILFAYLRFLKVYLREIKLLKISKTPKRKRIILHNLIKIKLMDVIMRITKYYIKSMQSRFIQYYLIKTDNYKIKIQMMQY